MIMLAEVEKLRGTRVSAPEILSLYLPVPLDPASARGMPSLARELTEAAQEQAGHGVGADLDAVLGLVDARSREWLGHTAAIFACGRLGLLDVQLLPGRQGPLGVLGRAPYLRPLLAAVQRAPAYLIAVVDRRRGWLLSVTAERTETIMQFEEPPAGTAGFGGWQGRDSYRVQHRMIERDRHHYRQVAALLARQATRGAGRPVVAGGHAESVGHLVRALPPSVRACFAGSFAADLHTLTPARAQELAGPVIDRWSARREREVAAAVLGPSSAGRRAVGVTACLAAAATGAISLLLMRDGALVPGLACDRCGALSADGPGCGHGATAVRPVPDLLDLLAGRVLDDGGQVLAVRDAPAEVAAQLRYPVARARAGTNDPEPATMGPFLAPLAGRQ